MTAGRAPAEPIRRPALPVWLMEEDDSAENLRNRAAPVFEQYNKLKRKGRITVDIEGAAITLFL